MTAKDQKKLLDAGFIILRRQVQHIISHDFSRKLFFKSKEHPNWCVVKKEFKSAAEMDRAINEMLKDKMTVETPSEKEAGSVPNLQDLVKLGCLQRIASSLDQINGKLPSPGISEKVSELHLENLRLKK